MNKFLLLFVLMFLVSNVSSGTQDVMFEFKLEYLPQIQEECVDSTIVNSTTNTTTIWKNCSITNDGTIKVIGGSNTYIGVLEKLTDVIPGRIYNGYKSVDLGNLSDITGINNKLDDFMDCNNKLNNCMDSNRNVSSQLILLKEDSGLKANFTECSASLLTANSNLEIKNAEINSKRDEIEVLEGGKFMWIIFGIIIGVVAIKVVVPKVKGTDIPISPIGKDHPPNPGY